METGMIVQSPLGAEALENGTFGTNGEDVELASAEGLRQWEKKFESEREQLEQWAWCEAGKWHFPSMETEDLVQELMAAAWDLIKWHDPAKGAFSTIVWNQWWWVTKRLMEHHARDKRGGLMAGKIRDEFPVGGQVELESASEKLSIEQQLDSADLSWIKDLPLHKKSKKALVLILTDDYCLKDNGTIHIGRICERLECDRNEFNEIRFNLSTCEDLQDALGIQAA